MIMTCAGCDRPILDKFLLTVLDRTWHAECVRCVDCRSILAERCFSRDAKLYCRADFFRYSARFSNSSAIYCHLQPSASTSLTVTYRFSSQSSTSNSIPGFLKKIYRCSFTFLLGFSPLVFLPMIPQWIYFIPVSIKQ